MATKVVHPFPDGLPADLHTSFGEQILYASRAEREAMVEPDRIGDDLAWEAVTFQTEHGGWRAHRKRLDSHETPNKLATPSHQLEVIERLEAKGAFFRSIQDPIDTGSPQVRFTLQVLGAAAEFERALIRERTKAGVASARTKDRVGGNPGLRAKDSAALRKVRLARQDGYMERLNEPAQDWGPHVRRLRPYLAWEDVLRIINGPLPEARRWAQSSLLRAEKAYVRDRFLPAIVAAIKGADPDITLQAICSRLEAMRERTPRGRTSWQPSSVKMLLGRGGRMGLL
jgi:hypothetical protein